MEPGGYSALELSYVVVFGLAAVVCVAGVRRAESMPDAATRRGLSGLFVLSGVWAGTEAAKLLVPGTDLKTAMYLMGLLAGFGTVWAWLYFCSAYTGHTYHRNRTLRGLGVAVCLLVFAVKTTNPLHGLYFSTSVATVPFEYLLIEHETLHWVVTGLSYALSAVGFYLLFELFAEVAYDTRRLSLLVGLTGLPVVLDVVSYASTSVLIGANYEPLGVAAFVVGISFVVEDSFLAVPKLGRHRLIQDLDDPVVFVDRQNHIQQYNDAAGSVFPPLRDDDCEKLRDYLPDVASVLDSGAETLRVSVDGREWYFVVAETPLRVGETTVGRVFLFTDVTRVERQREELDRQYSQFDRFATAMNHELRNALTAIRGNVRLATETVDDPDDVRDRLDNIQRSSARIEDVISTLSQVARHQQPIQELQRLEFRNEVLGAWEKTDTRDVELEVSGDGAIEGESGRFRNLLRSLFEYAVKAGASTVEVTLESDGFVVTEDGTTGSVCSDRAFEYGTPVPTADTGMMLPNVRTFARMFDWEVTTDPGYEEGLRVVVTGVQRAPRSR